jgi:hypothetical protein
MHHATTNVMQLYDDDDDDDNECIASMLSSIDD